MNKIILNIKSLNSNINFLIHNYRISFNFYNNLINDFLIFQQKEYSFKGTKGEKKKSKKKG